MPHRRTVLETAGAFAGTALIGGRVAEARQSDERFVVDLSTTSMDEMGDVEVVYDYRQFHEDVHYAAVECSESALPSGASYTADMTVDIEPPEQHAMETDAREEDEPLFDLQWDKQEQNITEVHETATGDGVRIGVIDDGVLGANPDDEFGHPDLPNVNENLSVNFTGDGAGPGPLNDDHGTHVAGTAAAADNGTGVVGVAPDAEIVDLRVFSGRFASFADVIAAVLYGAFVADCDVLNLSLGTPPLPADNFAVQFFKRLYEVVAALALASGTLPVAAAGNDGTRTGGDLIVLPANADGFLSVGATGPIGFGWPVRVRGRRVGPFRIESDITTELPTREPAFYTNYGGVDVTAPGGNVDIDAAVGSDANWFLDLLLATTFQTDPTRPEDERLDRYVPSFGFKTGTSFAAPTVSGLAALLAEKRPNAGPGAIRRQIEATALLEPIGRSGVTTAPGADVNEATDGDFDGDVPSSPGANSESFDPTLYRGAGHIDILSAVTTF